jgi:hypothetical protein
MADNKIIFEVVATAKGVKVVQQQTDKLATSTDEADKSTKKLTKSQDKQYGRQKQGLIQTANGTKNFSKLAQTIDGGGSGTSLVGAYATLAANVFAATAAFNALSRAAEFGALSEGLTILGSQSGNTLSVLSQGLRDVTAGALSMEQAMRGAALGASGGFGGAELEGLAKIAKGASITLGRDMADAFDRLTRGAIKLEPEILDELGIMVRLDDATEVYAASLNKTAGELTQLERRQAFMNAILVQGEAKFGSIADQVDSTPYQKLGATFADLTKDIFTFLNQTLFLEKAVGFLAENTGVLLGVMVAFGSTIASQMLPGLAQMAGNAAKAASDARDLADALADTSADELAAAKDAFLNFDGKGNFKKAQQAIAKGGDAATEYQVALTSLTRSEALRSANLSKYSGEELAQKTAELDAIIAKKLATEELIAAEAGAAASQVKATTAGVAANLAANQADEIAALTAGEIGLSAAIGTQIGNLKNYYKEMDIVRGKSNLLTKANGLLGVAFGSIAIAAKSVGVKLLAFLPTIAGVIIAIGVAYALYKAFNKETEKEIKLREQTEKLNEILDQANEKVKQYNILRAEAIPGAIKQVKLNENLENTIKEINTELKEQIRLQRELGELNRDDIGTSSLDLGFVNEFGEGYANLFGNISKSAQEIIDDSMFSNLFESEPFAEQLKSAEDLGAAVRRIYDIKDTPEFRSFERALLNPEYRTFLENEIDLSQLFAIEPGDKAGFVEFLKELTKNVQDTENAFSGSGSSVKGVQEELVNLEKVGSGLLQKMFKKSAFTDTLTGFANLKKGLRETEESAIKLGKNVSQEIGTSLSGAGSNVAKFLSSESKVLIKNIKLAEAELKKIGETDPVEAARLRKVISVGQQSLGEQGVKDLETAFTTLKRLNDEELTRKTRLDAVGKSLEAVQKITAKGEAGMKVQLAFEEKQLSIQKESMTAELTTLALANDINTVNRDRKEIIADLTAKAADYENNEEKIAEFAEISLKLEQEKARQLDEQLRTANKQEKMDLAREQFLLSQTAELEKQLTAQQDLLSFQNKMNAAASGRGAKESAIDEILRIEAADITRKENATERLRIEKEMAKLQGIIQKGQLDVLETAGAFKEELAIDANFVQNLKDNIDAAITASGETLDDIFEASVEKFGTTLKTKFAEIFGGDGDLAQGATEQLIAAMQSASMAADTGTTAAEKTNANLQLMKHNMKELSESTKEMFGEDGALISAMYNLGSVFAETALDIGNAFSDIDKAMKEGAINDTQGFLLKTSAVAGAIGGMLNAMQQVVAADAQTRTKMIDQAIEKEKKLDGKSKESVGKIKALEAKKEQIERKAFERRKKMQLAQAVMSTAQGVSNALASGFPPFNFIMAGLVAAMGMAQIAIIRKQQFQGGGGGEVPKPSAISVGGQRSNRVDVSQQASSGETAFLRGGMGVGSNANNFTPGAAMGRKGYANGDEGVVVGERGPEVINTRGDIIPNYELGGSKNMNLTFNVSALDGASVQEVLTNNQGAVVAAIRDAANSYGQDFLPEVNVGYGGDG